MLKLNGNDFKEEKDLKEMKLSTGEANRLGEYIQINHREVAD